MIQRKKGTKHNHYMANKNKPTNHYLAQVSTFTLWLNPSDQTQFIKAFFVQNKAKQLKLKLQKLPNAWYNRVFTVNQGKSFAITSSNKVTDCFKQVLSWLTESSQRAKTFFPKKRQSQFYNNPSVQKALSSRH